jgi:TRAP-type C4-dicarboxylate transport system permease small subunit
MQRRIDPALPPRSMPAGAGCGRHKVRKTKLMVLRDFARMIEQLSRLAVGLSFAVVIAAVALQVFSRSFLANSPVWTEELTRFAILFLAAFGTGLAYRSGDLVNVDIVSEALPGRLPWFLRLVSAGATAALCLILLPAAWFYTSIGALQTAPALGWRMDFVHASMLVMLASLFIFSALRFAGMLTGASDGLPAARED